MKTFKIIFSEIFFSNRGLLLVYWLVLFGITMLVLASGLSKSKSYLPLEALSIQLFMVFCSLPIVTGRIYDKYFTQGRCSFYLQLPIPIFNHRMVELVTLSLVAFIPYLFTLVTLSISTYIAGHWNSKGFLLFLPASLTTFFLVTATSIFSSTLGRIKGFLFVTVVFLPGYLISAKVNIGFEIADFTQPAKYYYLDHFPAIKLFSAAFVTGCLLNILYVIMVNYRDSQYLKFFKKETNNYWKASIVAYAALLIYLTVDVEKANLSKYTFSGF